jgi:hypothetical protein
MTRARAAGTGIARCREHFFQLLEVSGTGRFQFMELAIRGGRNNGVPHGLSCIAARILHPESS